MKKKQFALLVYFIPVLMAAQIINQDADGFSTIVMPAANLNLDITNSVATFDYYGYLKKEGKTPSVKDRRTLIGVSLKGKGVNGISNLFSNEKIVANASVGFLIGGENYHLPKKAAVSEKLPKLYEALDRLNTNRDIHWKNYENQLLLLQSKFGSIDQALYDNLFKLRDNSDPEDWKKARMALNAGVTKEDQLHARRIIAIEEVNKIYEVIEDSLARGKDAKTEIQHLETKLNSVDLKAVYGEKIFGTIKSNVLTKDDLDRWRRGREVILEELGSLYFQKKSPIDGEVRENLLLFFEESFIALLSQRKEVLKAIESIENSEWQPYFTTWYLKGSFDGVGFKYDLNNNSANIGDRFVNKSFNGYAIDFGYNVQSKAHNFFGFSAGASYTNNLGGLQETEYTFTRADSTITGGSFTTSSKIKAFGGNFDTFMRYTINFDYVRVFPIEKDGKVSDLYLTLNPYFRHRVYGGSSTLRNNTVVGLGFNAFHSEKQRLMGGLFVQTNDLFGIHTGEESTLGRRIVIGLIVKFAFKGIDLKQK